MYGLKTESSFDAAHFLTDYNGKCENLHGHRWRVVAYLCVSKLQGTGTQRDMVVEFADFKYAVRELADAFDHTFIVEDGSLKPETLSCLECEGFKLSIVPFRTTAENLAKYFADKLIEADLPVSQVDVYETPNNCAIYYVDEVADVVNVAGGASVADAKYATASGDTSDTDVAHGEDIADSE